jgi:hypothetical protein
MLPPNRALAVLALASAALGCGGSSSQTAPKDATAQSIASAEQRLRGRWVLAGYTPEIPLEPVLSLLVASEVGKLGVTFDRGRMIAEGPAVHVDRAYRVTEAYGDELTVVVYDETGVPTQSTAAFEGPALRFTTVTPPWRGVGVLQRPVP